MPTTSNFGWTTPADTDLVKDGAAAIRTLGNGIDTSFLDLKGGTTGQVLAKNSNTDLDFVWATDASGIPATIFDAKGDLIAASAADTAARLAVGTDGQYLSADSGETTGLKWVDAPTSAANWSLVNAGGTSLTGAQTITVSGISGADQLLILVESASSANTNAECCFRLNTDTGNNYYFYGARITAGSTYTASILGNEGGNRDRVQIAKMSSNANSQISGFALISGCNTAGVKTFTLSGGANTATGNGQYGHFGAGYYNSSSTISSISIYSDTGNWDNGTVYVYKTA
jgi:hypothetical protein